MSANLRRSAELIVAYWREHRAPDPDWPADLSFALASEVLLLQGERERIRDEAEALEALLSHDPDLLVDDGETGLITAGELELLRRLAVRLRVKLTAAALLESELERFEQR